MITLQKRFLLIKESLSLKGQIYRDLWHHKHAESLLTESLQETADLFAPQTQSKRMVLEKIDFKSLSMYAESTINHFLAFSRKPIPSQIKKMEEAFPGEWAFIEEETFSQEEKQAFYQFLEKRYGPIPTLQEFPEDLSEWYNFALQGGHGSGPSSQKAMLNLNELRENNFMIKYRRISPGSLQQGAQKLEKALDLELRIKKGLPVYKTEL